VIDPPAVNTQSANLILTAMQRKIVLLAIADALDQPVTAVSITWSVDGRAPFTPHLEYASISALSLPAGRKSASRD